MSSAIAQSATQDSEDRVLVITRIFDAPRELVFRAFTDPKHALKWMGPRDFPAHHVEADIRPGGKWRMGLRAAEHITDHRRGAELWQGGVYKEVVPPERLVWTFRWDAEPGSEDGAANPETLVTVTFAEHNGKTKMVFSQGVFNTKANRDGHSGGWNSSFDRLEELVRQLV